MTSLKLFIKCITCKVCPLSNSVLHENSLIDAIDCNYEIDQDRKS